MERVFHRARGVIHDMAVRSRGVTLALIALLALLIGVAVVGAAGPAAEPGVSQTTESGLQPTNTTMWIQLRSDGDARWTVTMSVELPDDRSTETFRTVAQRFETGQSDLLSAETFRRFVDRSRQVTDREMELVDVSRTTTIRNGTGQLALSFTWTNFSESVDGRLHVGDVFDSPDGTWLPGLTADQRLIIEEPESFGIVDAPRGITIRNETIRWTGPAQFEPSYISITYASGVSTTTTASQQSPPFDAGNLALVGIGIVALLVAVVGTYFVRSDRVGPGSEGSGGVDDRGDGGSSGGVAVAGTERATQADSTATAAPTGETGEDEPAPLDRELLSDEEYVEALIERNGGRMKQADIVSETGWSNAKVSQLLSTMAEEDRIEKLRIGRENLISFPGNDGES